MHLCLFFLLALGDLADDGVESRFGESDLVGEWQIAQVVVGSDVHEGTEPCALEPADFPI